MNDAILMERIEALEADIAESDPSDRPVLVAQLKRVVRTFEMTGGAVPQSVRERLEDPQEDEIEAQFDNLPV